MKLLQRYDVSKAWVEWYFKTLDGSQKQQVLEILHEGDANQKDLDMKETRNDTTLLFGLQLVLLIGVLVDYCFNLERPEGDFSCQWVYYSAIVMYKPYTVPMWVCLTYCGHYAFADYLYGRSPKGRDVDTGTPSGAPFERNRATLLGVGIVAALQFTWCAWTLPVSLPLQVVFFPAVLLVGFVLPFATTTTTQKGLAQIVHALKMKKEKKDEGNGEPSAATYTLQKLAPIDETQFILKACATQFVSLNILVFQLLPFYALGFEWWLEGSAAFLEGIFDLPRLWKDFTLSFAWPSFGYPRLYLPLLVGVLLIGVQLCFMAGKWLLRHGHVFLQLPLVASDAAAWSIERFTIQCLAMLTWRPFSKAADVAKAALETNWRQAKQDLSEARKLERKPGDKKDWR